MDFKHIINIDSNKQIKKGSDDAETIIDFRIIAAEFENIMEQLEKIEPINIRLHFNNYKNIKPNEKFSNIKIEDKIMIAELRKIESKIYKIVGEIVGIRNIQLFKKKDILYKEDMLNSLDLSLTQQIKLRLELINK